jgi:hypothetical protein
MKPAASGFAADALEATALARGGVGEANGPRRLRQASSKTGVDPKRTARRACMGNNQVIRRSCGKSVLMQSAARTISKAERIALQHLSRPQHRRGLKMPQKSQKVELLFRRFLRAHHSIAEGLGHETKYNRKLARNLLNMCFAGHLFYPLSMRNNCSNSSTL